MSSIYFLSTLDMFKKDIDYAHLISSGREKYGENKYEDSIEDFTKAIKTIPNFIDAYICRGKANFNLKKYEDSIEDFNQSIDRISTIETNPFSFLSYKYRGNAKFALKDFQGAIDDVSRAIELKEVYTAYFENEFIDRIINTHLGAKINPIKREPVISKVCSAFNQRGNAKFALKDFQGAIDDFNKAIEINPNEFLLYKNRASAKRKLGDYEGADEDNKKADRLKKIS